MTNEENAPEASPEPRGDAMRPEPQVFAVRRQEDVWRIGKRELLKTVTLGTVAGVAGSLSGCSDPEDDGAEDAIPPFESGGVTYRLLALPDYNARLPPSGVNLSVVAYVDADFYFRSFDEHGGLTLDLHESRLPGRPDLTELKEFTKGLAEKGTAEPEEQQRFAELVSATTSGKGGASGRRIQATEGSAEQPGRRAQGSTATGTLSGRRLPGAEGRVEAGSPPRDLGTLVVSGKRYEHTRLVESYTDGYSKLSHAGGVAEVRTDALPELVQMQTPEPIQNPSPRPATTPRTTTTTTTTRSKPSSSSRRSTGSHYWRPN